MRVFFLLPSVCFFLSSSSRAISAQRLNLDRWMSAGSPLLLVPPSSTQRRPRLPHAAPHRVVQLRVALEGEILFSCSSTARHALGPSLVGRERKVDGAWRRRVAPASTHAASGGRTNSFCCLLIQRRRAWGFYSGRGSSPWEAESSRLGERVGSLEAAHISLSPRWLNQLGVHLD